VKKTTPHGGREKGESQAQERSKKKVRKKAKKKEKLPARPKSRGDLGKPERLEKRGNQWSRTTYPEKVRGQKNKRMGKSLMELKTKGNVFAERQMKKKEK